MMIIKYLGVAILISLAGCAIPQRTTEEKIFNDNVTSCEEQTNVMLSPDHAKGDGSWGSYFEWCMGNKGYTKADLKSLWY